jgi:hypothetical protein
MWQWQSGTQSNDQFVYVYDEKGYHLGTLFAGNGPDDGLKGYTSTTVNVRGRLFTHIMLKDDSSAPR